MSTRKLNYFIDTSPALHNLTQQAQRLMALQNTLNSLAPQPLAQFCSVASFENNVLVIYTDNGAIASKLKQQLPTLLAKFQQRKIEVTSIRVEVQAQPLHTNHIKIKEIALSSGGIESLERLADYLEDSPLKSALAAMLARHTKKN